MFHLGCLQTLLSPHLAVPLNENTDSHLGVCGLGDRLVSASGLPGAPWDHRNSLVLAVIPP